VDSSAVLAHGQAAKMILLKTVPAFHHLKEEHPLPGGWRRRHALAGLSLSCACHEQHPGQMAAMLMHPGHNMPQAVYRELSTP
jgi:hypothetical protein